MTDVLNNDRLCGDRCTKQWQTLVCRCTKQWQSTDGHSLQLQFWIALDSDSDRLFQTKTVTIISYTVYSDRLFQTKTDTTISYIVYSNRLFQTKTVTTITEYTATGSVPSKHKHNRYNLHILAGYNMMYHNEKRQWWTKQWTAIHYLQQQTNQRSTCH